MTNENVYQKGTTVEELGFLIITPDKIGVTTSADDVMAVLGQYLDSPDTVLKIVPGEKNNLLEYAHKIICTDNISKMENGIFQYPAVPEANTLVHRPVQTHQEGLRRIIGRY